VVGEIGEWGKSINQEVESDIIAMFLSNWHNAGVTVNKNIWLFAKPFTGRGKPEDASSIIPR
jgi:hypothetical protein